MLYIDEKKIENLEVYKEELKKVFPSFFSNKNPKPVTIRYTSDQRINVKIKQKGSRVPERVKQQAPLLTSIKSVSTFVNEDGMSSRVAYTTQPPNFDRATSKVNYGKSATITLEEGQTLQPVVDLEKLIFLYFYSDAFVNGKNQSITGRFYFEMPEKDSERRIENGRLLNRIESLVMYGGMSDSQIYEAMDALKLEREETIALDRTRLFDYAMPDRLNARQEAIDVIEAIVGDKTSGSSEDIAVLVESAIEREVLKRDEKGWKVSNQKGVNAQAFSDVESVDELIAVLVQKPKVVKLIEAELNKV